MRVRKREFDGNVLDAKDGSCSAACPEYIEVQLSRIYWVGLSIP